MKKLIFFLTLLTFLGCDKEVPIQSVFDFDIGTVYATNGVVNIPRLTEFVITPERVVSTMSYSFRYTLSQGTGHFQDASGTIIPENQWTPLTTLEFSFNYIPTTVETHQLTVYIRDNSGTYEHERVLTYEVEHNDFTFTATATTTGVNVLVPIPVNFNLNQIGPGMITYTMVFESTANGTFEYAGVIYQAGEPITITSGASSGNYTGTSGGTHIVTFTVSNDNTPPVVMQDEISVIINDYLFDFIGSPEDNNIFSGETIDINFDVNETEGTSPLYEMRYIIDSGNAILRDALGNILTPDTYYNIDDAVNGFIWQVEGTNVGALSISFYIRNHIGNEESVTINIQVEQPSDFQIQTYVTEYLATRYSFIGDVPLNPRCARVYSSDVTFTVTHISNGPSLQFISLTRVSTGQVLDNTTGFLTIGQFKSYTDPGLNGVWVGNNTTWERFLIENEEYEVHFANPTTGEDIIKSFIAIETPDIEYLPQSCTFYD